MKKYTICYVASICSQKKYNDYFGVKKLKPAQQSVKYHRLLSEGFVGQAKNVFLVCNIPITPEIKEKKCINECEVEKGVQYRYVDFINLPIIKHVSIFLNSYYRVKKLLNEETDVVIVYDVLSRSVSIGALLASRKRAVEKIAVVTDLPEMFKNAKLHLGYYMSQYMISKAEGYIFMTDAMDERVNENNKPSVIMEGHVDINELSRKMNKGKSNKFVCLYAGAIARHYGLPELVNAFIDANIPNSELDLYGDGDYANELMKICDKYSCIKFRGSCDNEEVVKAEYEADLLINPRPTKEEYVKYSFPSKNMEYMVTGTPVLTTELPGMPEDHKKYVYLIKDESTEGIKQSLLFVSNIQEKERVRKGEEARLYVIRQKNNRVQAEKVLKMIRDIDRC